MPDLPHSITLNGQRYTRTTDRPPKYDRALAMARALIGDLESVNSEYIRGQLELLCDLYGLPMDDMLDQMGLPPDAASTYPPKPDRYKTNNVSLSDAIDLMLDQAQIEIEVGTDGRCKRLRDFYVQVGIATALRCVLSPDEKSADDLILERFLDAAESPEERAAIWEGQLNRPLLLTLHHEHQNAVRSVLINEIKHNHGLIAEILAAAETGV